MTILRSLSLAILAVVVRDALSTGRDDSHTPSTSEQAVPQATSARIEHRSSTTARPASTSTAEAVPQSTSARIEHRSSTTARPASTSTAEDNNAQEPQHMHNHHTSTVAPSHEGMTSKADVAGQSRTTQFHLPDIKKKTSHSDEHVHANHGTSTSQGMSTTSRTSTRQIEEHSRTSTTRGPHDSHHHDNSNGDSKAQQTGTSSSVATTSEQPSTSRSTSSSTQASTSSAQASKDHEDGSSTSTISTTSKDHHVDSSTHTIITTTTSHDSVKTTSREEPHSTSMSATTSQGKQEEASSSTTTSSGSSTTSSTTRSPTGSTTTHSTTSTGVTTSSTTTSLTSKKTSTSVTTTSTTSTSVTTTSTTTKELVLDSTTTTTTTAAEVLTAKTTTPSPKSNHHQAHCYGPPVIGQFCKNRHELGPFTNGVSTIADCQVLCNVKTNCGGIDYYPSVEGGQCVLFTNALCKLYASSKKDAHHQMVSSCEAPGLSAAGSNLHPPAVMDSIDGKAKCSWSTAEMLTNNRCTKELWSLKNISHTEAEQKCDSDSECKGLMWFAQNGGNGKTDSNGWYQGCGGIVFSGIKVGKWNVHDWNTFLKPMECRSGIISDASTGSMKADRADDMNVNVRLGTFSVAALGAMFALFALASIGGMATTVVSKLRSRRRHGVLNSLEYRPVSIREVDERLQRHCQAQSNTVTQQHEGSIYLQVEQEETQIDDPAEWTDEECCRAEGASSRAPLLASRPYEDEVIRMTAEEADEHTSASGRVSEWC